MVGKQPGTAMRDRLRNGLVGVGRHDFVVAVGADVTDGEGRCWGELVLDTEGPGNERGSLHSAGSTGDELGARRNRGGGIDRQLGDGKRSEGVERD